MNKEQAQELIEKYRLGICTPEEKALLERWYLDEATRQPMPESPENPLQEEQIIWNRIMEELPQANKVRRMNLWYSISAAAAILIFISAGLYIGLHKAPVQQTANNRPLKHDIAPGGNKAILTLSNGKKIELNDIHNGLLATENTTEIKKTADGKIIYTEAGETSETPALYNTVTTPRGGQFGIVLPDGSKVFLNAASSITYPTAFNGNERKVELTGEAYFEVAHNVAKPFRVSSNGQTVEVLGTHFNINAYNDEAVIKTTLLEGSVRISKNGQQAILKPGDQAQSLFGVSDSKITVIQVDTENAIAWKNGLFVFDGDKIEHIMRMISRWYNVDVDYNGEKPDDEFGGTVSRFNNVSEVLKTLQLTGKVRFRIENNKIVVTK
ncbi:FecR family protein [Mucilaginibacter sp. BT774]|uniref:FecR family protein n=1 Tax=Mucilaginibacter sp. BT774 TaxID=3062276 RepID=UPI0026750FB7|nr:FecR family protein [Mucilaginibacter sp. BT774]MDO3628246.1 DUF4974 domain-containing protein [Mucilaginibacter sp. BT774]